MTTIEKLDETLKTFGMPVYYGGIPYDLLLKGADWNYITFARTDIANVNIDFVMHYQVVIVMENYIPQDLIFSVIAAVRDATRMRQATNAIEFDYALKSETAVAERCAIQFAEPLKAHEVLKNGSN